MNSYLYLRIKNKSEEEVINKFKKFNINIYKLEIEEKEIIVKIDYKDDEKINKYFLFWDIKKEKYQGKKYFQNIFKRYYIFICFFLICFLFIYISSFFIVDINIIHEDESIRDLIKNELEVFNIKKFSFQKNYEELSKIKSEIKKRNLDKIDWIEIEKKGMTYEVKVQKRIINEEENKENYCNVISKKDGIIKSFFISSGQPLVNINDYVKKGDVLISGDVTLNESVVNHVCASGKVYAEVWYTVNIKVPLNYYEDEYTGKKRNNFIINYNGIDYQIFKDRLKNYISDNKLIFDLLGVKIYLKKEEEIKKNEKVYSEEEAIKKAIELAKEKVLIFLEKNDEIISEKVLQKTLIDSTINVDIFIVAKENIGSQNILREEENDS